MSKEITKPSVLKVLRECEKAVLKKPKHKMLLKIKRYDYHEDAGVSTPFDVEVSFTHPNYQYLISKLYDTNKNGIDEIDLSLMPRIKTVVEQLKNDEYLTTAIPTAQELSFHTEQEEQPTPPTQEEIEYENDMACHPSYKPRKNYINARYKFSEDELETLNIKILLTPKGLDKFYGLKKSFFDDPIKWLKFIFAMFSALVTWAYVSYVLG